MYYYIEEPEVQTPEHRSIVLASLAGYFSLMLACFSGKANLFIMGETGLLFNLLLPMLVSFTVLYRGCLYTDFGRLVRIMRLLVVAFLIFIGIQVFLGSILSVAMIGLSILSKPW